MSSSKPILLIVIGILAVILVVQTTNFITGLAAENMTAVTSVGGANVPPYVFNVNFTMNPALPCDNDSTPVSCTAIVNDLNGVANVTTVNGTLWSTATTEANCNNIAGGTQDNLSFCYFNATCTNTTIGGNNTAQIYTCSFGATAGKGLRWYANNGTWNCSMWATDGLSTVSNNSGVNTGTHSRSPMYAVDINNTISWGDAVIGTPKQVNNSVRNCGNRPQDTRVNASDLNCTNPASVDIGAGNISVGLTVAANNITNMNATLQWLNTSHEVAWDGNETINRTTYWNITLPSGVIGACTGTATFNAIENS